MIILFKRNWANDLEILNFLVSWEIIISKHNKGFRIHLEHSTQELCTLSYEHSTQDRNGQMIKGFKTSLFFSTSFISKYNKGLSIDFVSE